MKFLKFNLLPLLILILSQSPEISAVGKHWKKLGELFFSKWCQCREYKLSELKESMTIDQENSKVIHLKYKMDSKSKLGVGAFGNIYHAYLKENKQCAALKITKEGKNFAEADNEIEVLQYFSTLPEEERTSIIKIIGFKKGNMETNTSANIVLELGGMNLLAYFQQKIGQNYIYKESIHEGIIKNMLKCAAVAIQQFHKHGIHLDIKPNNFVIPHGHNLNAPLEFCKLIDFNCSVLTKESKAKKSGKFGVIPYIPFEFTNKNDVFEVSREIDVYSFGVMIYKFMFSPHMIMVNIDIEKFGNGSLDRIAKACLQNDPKNRPSIQAIISFLEEKCHYFSCEDKEQYSEYQKLCED